MSLVHDELHRIAEQFMAGERVDHTLQPTALVNEAYLRLANVQKVAWVDRNHFFAMSARVMRRVLVDFARLRRAQKRGAGELVITLDPDVGIAHEPAAGVLALDDALEALAQLDDRKSQVVELRFFGGLSIADVAQVLDVSVDTVMRDWRLAKAWLSRELSGENERADHGP